MAREKENNIVWVSQAALLISFVLGACSAREGIDIDDPEISSAYEKYQEALAAYEEVAEVDHAWSTTADLLRLSYLALEDDEPEESLKYSATASEEAELAYKQYNQQYEYADVFGVPLRCANFFPEFDCPGYAAYAEANTPSFEQEATESFEQEATESFEQAAIDDAATPVSSDSSYVVVKGDNLWKISAKSSIYGDPFRWPLIFKTNASKIKDADLIFPKQRFNIFRGFDPAEIDRAVLHARTRGAWLIGEREASDDSYLAQ